MVIKKYLVKSINEAMSKIRIELGKDAIIISQRKVRKSGFSGLFSGKLIEVIAAVETPTNEEKNVERVKNNVSNEDDDFKKSIESIKRLMENKFEMPDNKNEGISNLNAKIQEHNENVGKERNNHNMVSNEKEVYNNKVYDNKPYDNKVYDNRAYDNKVYDNRLYDNKAYDNEEYRISVEYVHKEVEELRNLIKKALPQENKQDVQEIQQESSEKLNYLKNRLKEIDIAEEFYDDILKSALDYKKDDLSPEEILRDIFERETLVANNELKGRVVLVGPTGVGKTTTIAKLVGKLALVEKKKVGLITIDTYRIGAIEQLKTYAEIMNIPFKVVITINEMEEAIKSMNDCDVILIDTTGRSSKNSMQISELRAFIQKANPNCVNMVISATTKNRDIKTILKGYSGLEYGSIIITKLDETTVYGSIYNISKNCDKPISFITTGQNVPDDIKLSSKEELTRFILGEETLC